VLTITRREFLASSSAALAVASAPAGPGRKPFPFFQPVDPPRPVQAMAHRGMATRAPENTRFAIEACVQDFIEWAEVDVRLTRDGKHVIFHDSRLDGKTDGNGLLAGLALDELQKLDAGAWFAPRFKGSHLLSLPEILELAKGKVNLYLDCKTVDPELLVKEVRAARMENQVIVYGTPAMIAAVQKASGGTVPVMAKYRPKMDFDAFLRDVAAQAVEVDAEDVTTDLCKKFHTAGVIVQANVLGAKWDNVGSWPKMIAAGVDWLQTDDPAGVLSAAARTRLANWPVMIAHHRGANRYAPENTLPAITTAVALGADYVEIDIRTTKDGQFVLMHDATVDRTTDGTGRVNELTLAVRFISGPHAPLHPGSGAVRSTSPPFRECAGRQSEAGTGPGSLAFGDAQPFPHFLIAQVVKLLPEGRRVQLTPD
jgi:glycerophosphoryl diester phosphodiesterase